jgi:hypothetical protein
MGGLEIALNVKKPICFLNNLKLLWDNDRKGPNYSLVHLHKVLTHTSKGLQ